MGDFNIKWDVPSFLHSTLEHSLEAFDITRIPFGATHHRGNSHTTIDYICVSDISRVLSYNQVHWSSISLQDALFATFNFEVQPVDPRVITLRSFKNMNTAHFLRDLEDINWTEIVHIPDIDAKVEFFTSSLIHLYNKHTPYRLFVAKNHPTPWLNKEVKTLIKERNKALRKHK